MPTAAAGGDIDISCLNCQNSVEELTILSPAVVPSHTLIPSHLQAGPSTLQSVGRISDWLAHLTPAARLHGLTWSSSARSCAGRSVAGSRAQGPSLSSPTQQHTAQLSLLSSLGDQSLDFWLKALHRHLLHICCMYILHTTPLSLLSSLGWQLRSRLLRPVHI